MRYLWGKIRGAAHGIKHEWKTASSAKRVGYISAAIAGMALNITIFPAVAAFWGVTRAWEAKRRIGADRRLRRRLARAEQSPALHREDAASRPSRGTGPDLGADGLSEPDAPRYGGRGPSRGGDTFADPALDDDIIDAEIVDCNDAAAVEPESWWASQEGLDGAVPAAEPIEPEAVAATSEPSIVGRPEAAAGHATPDGLTDAQRHLVDELKVAYIEEFGLAVTDGDTTTFVSADSHPGIRSDERVVDPVKLQVLANRVESDLVTDLPTWARDAVAADLQARPLSDYATQALADLGLEQGTVEVTVLRPIDPGVVR